MQTFSNVRTGRGVPAHLASKNLYARPVTISKSNFNSVLRRRQCRLLRVGVHSSTGLTNNARSNKNKLIKLTHHGEVNRYRNSTFANSNRNANSRFVLGRHITFSLSKSLLQLLIGLNLSYVRVFNRLFSLHVTIFRLINRHLARLFTQVKLRLLSRRTPHGPSASTGRRGSGTVRPSKGCESLLVSRSQVKRRKVRQAIRRVISRLRKVVINFATATSTGNHNVVKERHVIKFREPGYAKGGNAATC